MNIRDTLGMLYMMLFSICIRQMAHLERLESIGSQNFPGLSLSISACINMYLYSVYVVLVHKYMTVICAVCTKDNNRNIGHKKRIVCFASWQI